MLTSPVPKLVPRGNFLSKEERSLQILLLYDQEFVVAGDGEFGGVEDGFCGFHRSGLRDVPFQVRGEFLRNLDMDRGSELGSQDFGEGNDVALAGGFVIQAGAGNDDQVLAGFAGCFDLHDRRNVAFILEWAAEDFTVEVKFLEQLLVVAVYNRNRLGAAGFVGQGWALGHHLDFDGVQSAVGGFDFPDGNIGWSSDSATLGDVSSAAGDGKESSTDGSTGYGSKGEVAPESSEGEGWSFLVGFHSFGDKGREVARDLDDFILQDIEVLHGIAEGRIIGR